MTLRLLVEVEGQTEEQFVKEALAPYLLRMGYERVDARILGNTRQRSRRGGIRNWQSANRDIIGHLSGDRGRIVTTMVDYYALPASGNDAWPGRADAARLVNANSTTRAETVEAALLADITQKMGSNFDPRRFVPYVAMHEYEGLLFSDCITLAKSLEQPSLAPQLSAIRAAFATPEDVNDSSQTAPSKRIQSLMKSVEQLYEKPFHGVLALLEIGLDKVRAECPHFDRWVRRLEDRITAKP